MRGFCGEAPRRWRLSCRVWIGPSRVAPSGSASVCAHWLPTSSKFPHRTSAPQGVPPIGRVACSVINLSLWLPTRPDRPPSARTDVSSGSSVTLKGAVAGTNLSEPYRHPLRTRTHHSRKRTHPRIRTLVCIRTRCVYTPTARVNAPARVYAPDAAYTRGRDERHASVPPHPMTMLPYLLLLLLLRLLLPLRRVRASTSISTSCP